MKSGNKTKKGDAEMVNDRVCESCNLEKKVFLYNDYFLCLDCIKNFRKSKVLKPAKFFKYQFVCSSCKKSSTSFKKNNKLCNDCTAKKFENNKI